MDRVRSGAEARALTLPAPDAMLAAVMNASSPHADSPVAREEIVARLRDPALTLVNVLSEEAFAAGRIPGSVSLPLASIPEEARRVLPDPSREIIVYCGSFT